MADKTAIEWCDATWNPVRGCSLVSDGCKNCYAMGVAGRFGGPGQPYDGLTVKTTQGAKWTGKIMLVPAMLDQPLRWTKPRKIFVNSMSDLFHEGVQEDYIRAVFSIMATARQHTFQVLTKRPERMRDVLAKWEWEGLCLREGHGVRLPNVWLGVSVEDQAAADERIPLLLETPAAVRWLSMEPLLGAVDLTPHLWGKATPCADCGCLNEKYPDCDCGFEKRNEIPGEPCIDWVVVGGESGPKARPMHPGWARELRDQCKAAGVPFLFKQWGEWAPHEARAGGDEGGDLRRGHVRYLQGDGREFDGHFRKGDAAVARVGKKSAGRLLDGRLHDGYADKPHGDTKS